MGYYSAIKKNENAICSDMDRPRDYHDNWSKADEVKQISLSYHSYVKSNLRKWYKWTYSQNRNRPIDMETNLWLPKGKHGEKT